MTRRRRLKVAAALIFFPCFYVATLPMTILYGKIAEPPSGLVLEVLLTRTLPILAIAFGMILSAVRIQQAGAEALAWAVLALAVPACFGLLYVGGELT